MATSAAVQGGFRSRSLTRAAAAALAWGICSVAATPGSASQAAEAAQPTPAAPEVGVVRSVGQTGFEAQAPQTEPCNGVDLVKALQASDPQGFSKFEDAARGVVNGQGLLWRVERVGGRVSYLFGTMHSSDAEAKNFDDLVVRALGRARTVAIELPGASTRRVAAELRRLVGNRSFRPSGATLGLLPEHVRPRVEARIAKAGIPPAVANQLQPWYLALSISRATCVTPVAGSDTETADGRIERIALEKGARIVALETPVEQVEALSSIPDSVALRMLQDAAERGMKPEDVESTISGLYSTRRIGYLLAMRGPAWAGIFDVDGYAGFLSAFITRRNAAMLQRALPVLADGDAFLAVGALHLPGENGLVEMIRRSGYSVTRIW